MIRQDDGNAARTRIFTELFRLPEGVSRPDHYALLGVPRFEKDRGAIVRASLERIELLQTCEGPRRAGLEDTAPPRPARSTRRSSRRR
jgi:hypothetical protein